MAPQFQFHGRSMSTHEEIRGELVGQSLKDAISRISELHPDVTLIEVRELKEPPPAGSRPLFPALFRLKHQMAVAVFFRQLAMLLRVGIPILRALQVSGGSRTPAVRSAAARMAQGVNEGEPLSRTMAQHPLLFSNLAVALSEAGEASGTLPTMLDRIADLEESSFFLRRRIWSAVTYPLALTLSSLGTLVISMAALLPPSMRLVHDLNIPLPLPTRLLHQGFSLITSRGFLLTVVGILLAVGVSVSWWLLSSRNAPLMARLPFRLPLLRTFLLKGLFVQFTHTLGTLLAGGIPIIKALDLAKPLLARSPLDGSVEEIRAQVVLGTSFGEALRGTALHSPILYHLAVTGEHAGKLDRMLLKVSEFYQIDLLAAVTAWSRLLEPAALITLSLLTAAVAIIAFLPYFSLLRLA